MTSTIAIEQLVARLVEYVVKNRRGRAFLNWTVEDMDREFRDGILHKMLVYATDQRDDICGIVHGYADESKKQFHVANILSSKKFVLPKFIQMFDMLYPGYTLVAKRHDKIKTYNLPQFRRKVQHIID
jgi:hypothetical protein